MRSSTVSLVFAVILAFFTLSGVIDVRSSAQQQSMASTTLSSSLDVPTEFGITTIDGSPELEPPFAFTSSLFGDVSRWTIDIESGTGDKETMSSESKTAQPEYDQAEDMLDNLIANILQHIATSVEPPFNRAALILAIITILTLFKTRIMAFLNFTNNWSKKTLKVELGQPEPEGCHSCLRAIAKFISWIDLATLPFQIDSAHEKLLKDNRMEIVQLNVTIAQMQAEIDRLTNAVKEKEKEIKATTQTTKDRQDAELGLMDNLEVRLNNMRTIIRRQPPWKTS
ncbi:hypothetical protein J7337_001793 [Fusarium musae]|uniref:Uncharacterized protein n=1 Tax=Fusarium musae TaxID=1042133 RepID=A0A9P8DU69_9HYPO|nr:hypothetical protein J7337_001793 [Fusarium musae]KAG9508229.1 hypothetical protein J7337_001793 [Fusarium musae]